MYCKKHSYISFANTSISVVSQKIYKSYSWWGWIEPQSKYKTETTSIWALKGVRLSKAQKIIYEEINHLILANTDEDAVVYGFPHIKIFNIITGRTNCKTFVPVLLYDVVSDKYVSQELALLKKNMPEIFIFEDIPSCSETHENVFREGKKLEQRKILEWFESIKDEKYILIGKISNFYIYRLGNGDPINYTHIYKIKCVFYPEVSPYQK